MTVAIKGMDMPKSCSECHFLDTGIRVNVCKLLDEKVENISYARRWNCPLTELPEENKDMSWEELVEKCKSKFNMDISNNKSLIINLSCGDLVLYFNKDKSISFFTESEKNPIYDKSYFGMYQIIKALIGETK